MLLFIRIKVQKVQYFRGSNSFGQLAHMSRRRTEDCNLVLGQVVADQLLIQVQSTKGSRSAYPGTEYNLVLSQVVADQLLIQVQSTIWL